ncbi:MAG: RsmB/NOP family class I SAM-dependent RNA methyltransferase [Candidatus Nanopelagicales bacterium]
MSRPRTSSRTIDPARRAAYDVLHEVGAGDAYANLVIRHVLADRRLDGRDAAFATELVMGSLRQRGTLDAVLGACVDRPLDKLDPRVLDVLRLGSYQLLYLATPAHAAVASSVDLAGEVCGPGPRGLVNAVLRKVSRRDLSEWCDELTAGLDSTAALALRTSHPRWIVAALRDALGPAADELPELLAIDNEAPTVTLVARPGRITVPELVSQTKDGQPGRWSPLAVRLAAGRPGDIPAIRDQRAGVQDEGSQLMALALTDAPLEGRDERWLDLCAGPGGKSALLAAIGSGRGATLVAVEPRAARARLVRRALSGAPGAHLVVRADGRQGPWQPGTFDRVLVDAPCSGIGVLRRRPEARWRRSPADVAELARLQRDLLRAALAAVRPGGLVAYVTCSPHIAETDLVVDDVLRGRDDVEEVDARAGLPPGVEVGPGPRVRLWPHRHGTDGMFCALLRTRARR